MLVQMNRIGIIINIPQYSMDCILLFNRQENRYIHYVSTALYILWYGMHILQYGICISWYVIFYDILTRFRNKYQTQLNEFFALITACKFRTSKLFWRKMTSKCKIHFLVDMKWNQSTKEVLEISINFLININYLISNPLFKYLMRLFFMYAQTLTS